MRVRSSSQKILGLVKCLKVQSVDTAKSICLASGTHSQRLAGVLRGQ
jgi:hypothetical protein